MSRRFLLLVAISIALLTSAPGASAQAVAFVRGRIVRAGPMAPYPAGGVAVTVWNATLGRSAPVFTGPDGMFYMSLPPGLFTFEVWSPYNQVILAQAFPVGLPQTDVPQMLLPLGY
jgi:hypothetical protein